VTTPQFDTTFNSARAVTNVAVGANYPLSPRFRVHAGFSTDGSPVGDETQSLFRKVNLSRFTAGVSLTGTRLSGSLGFGYSFGSGTRQSLGDTEGGQQTETRLSVKTANLLFALSYGVGP
jgi:long-subunit fatty acid transport protein